MQQILRRKGGGGASVFLLLKNITKSKATTNLSRRLFLRGPAVNAAWAGNTLRTHTQRLLHTENWAPVAVKSTQLNQSNATGVRDILNRKHRIEGRWRHHSNQLIFWQIINKCLWLQNDVLSTTFFKPVFFQRRLKRLISSPSAPPLHTTIRNSRFANSATSDLPGYDVPVLTNDTKRFTVIRTDKIEEKNTIVAHISERYFAWPHQDSCSQHNAY